MDSTDEKARRVSVSVISNIDKAEFEKAVAAALDGGARVLGYSTAIASTVARATRKPSNRAEELAAAIEERKLSTFVTVLYSALVEHVAG